MKRTIALAASWLAWPALGGAQTAAAPAAGYFYPPPGAVTSARPVRMINPVIDSHLLDRPAPALPDAAATQPWFETDLGVLGIGLAATGLTMVFDHGINQFTFNHTNLHGHRNDLLYPSDALEIAPLAFAAVTMFQSPISDPRLAHASSIAITAAAAVTIEVQMLKFGVGRDSPTGPDSSPFVAHPFDASRSSIGIGGILPGDGADDSSFVSGRTALTFALVTPYAEIYHQPLLYAAPAAVGLSRLAEDDRHWASDVVAGGFLGWLTADLTRRVFPNSDYGLMIFGDGRHFEAGISGRF